MFTAFKKPAYMVKVNLRNTTILWYLSIFNALLYVLMFLLPAKLLGLNIYPFVFVESWLYSTACFVYIIMILLWFKEQTAIVAAFTMFTVLLEIAIAVNAFPGLLKVAYTSSLDILLEVVSLLVVFRSFMVKAAPLSLPFKLFGASIALISLPRFFMMLVSTVINEQVLQIVNDIGLLLMLGSLAFILKGTLGFLRSNPEGIVEEVVE